MPRLASGLCESPKEIWHNRSIFASSPFPDAGRVVDTIEKRVLSAKANEVMMLRESMLDDCTILVVEVSFPATTSL